MKTFICFFFICIFRSKNCVWLNWVFIQRQTKKGRMFCLIADYPSTACTLQQALTIFQGMLHDKNILAVLVFLSNKHCCVLLGCSLMVPWEGAKKERMCSLEEIVLLMEFYREKNSWIEGDGFWLMILLERAVLLLCTPTDNWETNTTFRV